eukprot:891350-Prorocentrum_minimum.AAC.1
MVATARVWTRQAASNLDSKQRVWIRQASNPNPNIPTQDQSDAGSVGTFSRWTNQTAIAIPRESSELSVRHSWPLLSVFALAALSLRHVCYFWAGARGNGCHRDPARAAAGPHAGQGGGLPPDGAEGNARGPPDPLLTSS